MRIVYIGAVKFSEQCLKKLIKIGYKPVYVCTLKESRFNTDHVDLTEVCNQNNISVGYMPDINTKKNIDRIRSYNPDIIFCFGWSHLLKSRLLQVAPLGIVGYHPTNLPKNRGRHPIIWALILGLTETASTFFFMEDGADSGDIISKRKVPIIATDDAKSLYNKIIDTAVMQIEKFVPTLASGNYKRFPQKKENANYWRKRGRIDGKIDWRMSAKSIHNLVRGLTKPYVGAHFEIENKEIKVWKTEIYNYDKKNIEPGKIIDIKDFCTIVKAGEDAIRLIEIEPFVDLEIGSYL